MLRTTTRRPGFTLVELMVAAAVCVLIMAVLATAFQLGIDTMRQMRSTGEMMDQLRGATTALKTDLKAVHLIDSDGRPKRLSEYRWDKCFVDGSPGSFKVRTKDVNNNTVEWTAPTAGFIRIGNGFGLPPTTTNPATGVGTYEGADADGLASFRATSHYLHFTGVLSGQSEEEYYYANIPGVPTYSSTAAEIAYFLDPGGATTPGGVTTFRLIRRQRLVALNDTARRDRRWPQVYDTAVFSFRPTGANPPFFLNTLQEITDPLTRLSQSFIATPSGVPNDLGLAPIASVQRVGEDTLLSNVISFEVLAVYVLPPVVPAQGFPVPTVAGAPRAFGTVESGATTSSAPFDFLPQAPPTGNTTPGLADPANKNGMCVFDSWSMNYAGWTNSVDQKTGAFIPNTSTPPLLARVQALQIRIRIWDPKLQNARQVTFIQDL